MAYGKKSGSAKLMGTKIGNHKGGPGYKLHSDLQSGAAKGIKKAPKMSRKAV